MPIVEIGGKEVTLGDDFLKLSPDQQNSTIDEIASTIGVKPKLGKAATALDAVKSGGVGLGEGLLGIAGMGGDIRQLASGATDLIAGKLGASPEKTEAFKSGVSRAFQNVPGIGGIVNAPTSDDLTKKVEGYTGKFYEPQTGYGQVARTVGQFAPNAVFGPTGAVRRGAQVVWPALASEGAGYATQGTAAEPYARLGASILASGAAGAVPRRPTVSSADDLFASATQRYQSPEVQNLRINPSGPARMADDAIRAAERGGVRPYNSPGVYSAVDELRNLPSTTTGQALKAAGLPVNATVDDIKGVRTVLNEAQQSGTDALTGKMNTTAKGARTAKQKITNYLDNIPPGDVVSGDAVAAGKKLSDATGDYAAAMRMKTVESLGKRAEANTGSANSGQNSNNNNRKELKKLLLNERANQGYSDPEMSQLGRAVLGTKTGNTARIIGNALAPSGALALGNSAAAGALGAGAGYLADKDPTTSAIVAGLASQVLGRGARMVGNASTARQAQKFRELVGRRSPLYQELLANTPKLALPEASRAALVSALMQQSPLRITVNPRTPQTAE